VIFTFAVAKKLALLVGLVMLTVCGVAAGAVERV
jgi:hypothetical protein